MSTRLAGFEGLLRRQLEERLAAAGRSGLPAAALVAGLEGDWSEAEVEAALAALERDGVAAVWSRRWRLVRHTDWTAGRVRRLERGDAVIESGAGGEPGYFVARRHLRGARNGDEVLVRRQSGRRRRRGGLPEAVVVKVVSARPDRLVATVLADGELAPFDPKLEVDAALASPSPHLEGLLIVAELAPRGGRGGRGRARVAEVLGPPDGPGVDVLAVLRHYAIPDEFPPAVTAAAETLPREPGTADLAGRRDFSGLPTVTIDGATSRDFDDAVSVESRSGGGFRLSVHIADVAHYVGEGTVLDGEAYRRGTSVYFPDRAVPMLPERLSNDLCSLKPGVPRLTMSAVLDFSSSGSLEGRSFVASRIRSDRRLTYDEVRRILEKPAAGDRQEYGGEVLELLERGRALMRLLFRRRVERGSIDFDLPEGDVILDTDGAIVGVKPADRTVAHRMIEEFMIATNEAVATELYGAEAPTLYRVHDEPNPDRVAELAEFLKVLGIPFEAGHESLHPSALQDVLARVEGHPEEPFVAALVLRTMQRARYHPQSLGHYALASPHYLHFTSPIRRYPDLVVHRQLKRLLAGESTDPELLSERLPAIAESTSGNERRAERAERTILQWKVVRLLADRCGDRFAGRVTGVQPFGIFVQLSEYFVDGLVPIAFLTDDFYDYLPERHRLVGRDGEREFRLADELEVVLVEVDPVRRSLVLQPAGMAPPERRSRRRGPAKLST